MLNPRINTIPPLNGFDLTEVDSNGTLSRDNGTRTVSLAVKAGESSFYFWANNKKFEKTTTQTATIPDTTGAYYIYFDNNGVMQYVASGGVTLDTFYEHAIVALVYWNATTSTGMCGNERHGIIMSSSTHYYNHATIGARYESGIDPTGITVGNTTYTNTTAGFFWDEDIRHTIALDTTHPFLYRLGATGEWTSTTADNEAGYKEGGDTYYSWNEWTGATWQLTEGGVSTDYFITFFVATPDISGQQVKKIIGQNAYSTANAAREAISTELQSLNTNGLFNPEIVFLYAIIVKRDGEVQALEDGNSYLDLRYIKGVGGSSGTGDMTTATYDPAAIEEQLVGLTATQTLTNKRLTARVATFASDATPDVDSDDYDAVTITAQAAAITDVNVTGTPTNFQKLIFRIKDDGTARAITRGSDFEDAGVALPTTTVVSKLLTVGFIYNTVTSKRGCVAVANET